MNIINQNKFNIIWETSHKIYNSDKGTLEYQNYSHKYKYEFNHDTLVLTIDSEPDIKFYYRKNN